MRAIEWSPGLMQRTGLRRLFWNERTHQTTTNPSCPSERSGSLPSAWQLILPPGTLEGGNVSFPRSRGMWQHARFRLRVLIRTAPPASGGQDVLLFDFDDLLTMELATPLAAPDTRQDVVLPLPPWPPGIAALREQYCVHTGWPQGRQCRQCWPDEPPYAGGPLRPRGGQPGDRAAHRRLGTLRTAALRRYPAGVARCRPRWPRRLIRSRFPSHESRLPNRCPVRSWFPTSTVRAAYGPASTVLAMELI